MIQPGGPERPRAYPESLQDASTPDRAHELFRSVPSAVAAVAGMVDGEPVAMLVSSFTTGVSFDPPMCLFSVQHSSSTWPTLERAQSLGVSFLSDRHQDTVMSLASREKDQRLAGIDWTVLESGAVLLYDSPLWIETSVVHRYPAGDHTIIVVGVDGYSLADDFAALIAHRRTFGTYPLASRA